MNTSEIKKLTERIADLERDNEEIWAWLKIVIVYTQRHEQKLTMPDFDTIQAIFQSHVENLRAENKRRRMTGDDSTDM